MGDSTVGNCQQISELFVSVQHVQTKKLDRSFQGCLHEILLNKRKVIFITLFACLNKYKHILIVKFVLV